MGSLTGTLLPNGRRWSIPRLDAVVRKNIGTAIRNYIFLRIGAHGKGEGGRPVRGYSTRPVNIPIDGQGGMKPMKPPTGGQPRGGRMFFKGGYKAYREKAGLEANRFVLTNTGDLWRDFRILRLGSGSTPMHIGFGKTVNAIAANTAQDDGRHELFLLDTNEVRVIGESIITEINKALGY